MFLWFNVSRQTYCTFTSLYIYLPTTLHTISSQIHLDQEWCHSSSTFQWHLPNSHMILIHMSWLWPMKRACAFYCVVTAYDFDFKVRRCGFCKSCDWLWVLGCLVWRNHKFILFRFHLFSIWSTFCTFLDLLKHKLFNLVI